MTCKSTYDINNDVYPFKTSKNSDFNNKKSGTFFDLTQKVYNNQNNDLQVFSTSLDIPEIDSEILFQSNSIFECNENSDSGSTDIPLISFSKDSLLYSDTGSIDEFNEIQNNKKQLKISPQIQNINYFTDLIQKEINAPHLQTKQELLYFIEQYSIENYAQNHFRKQNSLIFFDFQSIKELTTFSMKPQSKPLLEKIPITKKNIIYNLSSLILTFIGVLHTKKQKYNNKDSVLISIIHILREDDTLIDEFFMQLMKTMRNSPSNDALLLSWKLFQTISSLFFVKDNEVSNVIRWFLIQNIYKDDLNSEYANYSLIRFYERSTIGRSYDSGMPIENILKMQMQGNEMIKCSLYAQMWNQRIEYPNLPIPLMLYLVVKALIKNGVMITKHPFPDLGQNAKEEQRKSINVNRNKKFNNENQNGNLIKCMKQYNEKAIKNRKDSNIRNDENANMNEINYNLKKTTDKKYHHHKNFINFDENEKTYQKANMKIVKMWAMKMNENHEIFNDGEVINLLGLIFLWMINLLDPIIPKSLSSSFIQLPIDAQDMSRNVKYKEFIDIMPLLHKNTLMYLIGFLREIAENSIFTHETNETIAHNLGSLFVMTSFITIDPFTRKKMNDISPHFILYCLDNLDVKDVYPLNPVYENLNTK